MLNGLTKKELCNFSQEEAEAIMMVWEDPLKIKDLPQSHTMALEAVLCDGMLLQFIDDEFMDYWVCLAAVEQTGCALQYVPEKFRDEHLLMVAVADYGYAVEWLTDEQRLSCFEALAPEFKMIYKKVD